MSGFVKAGLVATAGLMAAGVIVGASSAPRPAYAADKPAAQQCFNTHNINGFNAPNDHTVYLRIGVNDIYRLDLMQDCTGLSFRQDIGLRSVPPGDTFICSALQTEVVYHETGIPQRCQVSAMHKLNPDELAALPKKDRP